MAKIKRKEHQQFIYADTSGIGGTPIYEQIGCDTDDLSTDMNDNVESTENVCGGSSISITNGTRTTNVEPYKADDGTEIFKFLQDVIDQRKELDDRQAKLCNVQAWKAPSGSDYPAVEIDVMVEVVSQGGNTEGYQIPYNLHDTGVQRIGGFNPTTKVFTEGTWDGADGLSGAFTPTP